MRHTRLFAVAFGSAVLASACVTPGNTGSTTSAPAPAPGATSVIALRDSLMAQALAEHEGPRATIRAEFANIAGSRRTRGVFRLEDDAYVIIGHIDADGALRVVFPLDPNDDGFVAGDRTYRTQEFFAGYTAQFRALLTSGMVRPGVDRQSYDMGTGYLFMVASWRPMHFAQFATQGAWDTFDLTDSHFFNDPRPAIHEFAAMLNGESREAYTIEYARYNTSQSLYSSLAGGPHPAYNNGYQCSSMLGGGVAYTPLAFGRVGYLPMVAQEVFWLRGQPYYYDTFSDCYQPLGYYGGYQAVSAFRPRPLVPPVNTIRPRDRNPISPNQPERAPVIVMDPEESTNGNGFVKTENTRPTTSPTYRTRGLITSDDPSPGNDTRITARGAGESRRPPLQDMMQHRLRVQDASGSNEVNTAGRTEGRRNARDNEVRRSSEPRNETGRTEYRAPQPRSEHPRSESPRSAPAPRSEPVRSAPRRTESPRAEVPRSRPATPSSSTGSSSSGSSSTSEIKPSASGTP